MHTQVQKKSLNPIWDQTILFQALEIFGNKEYLKMYPPTVIFELYDRDLFVSMVFIVLSKFQIFISVKG